MAFIAFLCTALFWSSERSAGYTPVTTHSVANSNNFFVSFLFSLRFCHWGVSHCKFYTTNFSKTITAKETWFSSTPGNLELKSRVVQFGDPSFGKRAECFGNVTSGGTEYYRGWVIMLQVISFVGRSWAFFFVAVYDIAHDKYVYSIDWSKGLKGFMWYERLNEKNKWKNKEIQEVSKLNLQ